MKDMQLLALASIVVVASGLDAYGRWRPVQKLECPADRDIGNCPPAGVTCGDLCEGDGENGTDNTLNNCGAYDVYKWSCSHLRLLDSHECPAEPNIVQPPNCGNVKTLDSPKCGEMCEGDGERGTDRDANNCGAYDVYVRECPGILRECPDKTRRLRPLDPSECPADADLPACVAAGCGKLCEADGGCAGPTRVDNCENGFDVYQVMCLGTTRSLSPTMAPTQQPTQRPTKSPTTSAPTTAPTQQPTRFPTPTLPTLREVEAWECPLPGLGNCNNVKCGHLCEGSGEHGTDDSANNCGDYDVYVRECPSLLECGQGRRRWLRPVDASECPGVMQLRGLKNCDKASGVQCGELCEGDGECNTDQSLDNCYSDSSRSLGSKSSVGAYDVYEVVCLTRAAAFVECGTARGLWPIDAADCPVDANLSPCVHVACGELCEGDGECNTDASLDNCGPYDVYRVVCDASSLASGALGQLQDGGNVVPGSGMGSDDVLSGSDDDLSGSDNVMVGSGMGSDDVLSGSDDLSGSDMVGSGMGSDDDLCATPTCTCSYTGASTDMGVQFFCQEQQRDVCHNLVQDWCAADEHLCERP